MFFFLLRNYFSSAFVAFSCIYQIYGVYGYFTLHAADDDDDNKLLEKKKEKIINCSIVLAQQSKYGQSDRIK